MHFSLLRSAGFSFLIALIIIAAGCGTESGTERQKIDNMPGTFNQNPTLELRIKDGLLYAATEGGLFRKPINPADTEWESLGLGNATVHAFLIFSGQELLASATYENSEMNTIAKTTDGGNIWLRFRNGYSADINNRVPRAMAMYPTSPDVLFAVGPGGGDIAKSTEKGNSWELVLGTWENLGFFYFIRVDNNDPDRIWAGGSNAVFRSALVKSMDGGSTWQNVPPTGAETNVNDLIIKPAENNEVLAGMGIGVYRSNDGGNNWDPVFKQAAVYTLAHSARTPQTIYASGQNAAGSLFFAASPDFGDSWQLVEVPDAPANIRINDIVSVMVNGQEVLYFGTNKGVYSYRFDN